MSMTISKNMLMILKLIPLMFNINQSWFPIVKTAEQKLVGRKGKLQVGSVKSG